MRLLLVALQTPSLGPRCLGRRVQTLSPPLRGPLGKEEGTEREIKCRLAVGVYCLCPWLTLHRVVMAWLWTKFRTLSKLHCSSKDDCVSTPHLETRDLPVPGAAPHGH